MVTLVLVVVEVDAARCVVVVVLTVVAVEMLVAVVLVVEWATVVALLAAVDEGWLAQAAVVNATRARTHTKRRRPGVISPLRIGPGFAKQDPHRPERSTPLL
jgi:hypothetical protein